MDGSRGPVSKSNVWFRNAKGATAWARSQGGLAGPWPYLRTAWQGCEGWRKGREVVTDVRLTHLTLPSRACRDMCAPSSRVRRNVKVCRPTVERTPQPYTVLLLKWDLGMTGSTAHSKRQPISLEVLRAGGRGGRRGCSQQLLVIEKFKK